MFDPEVLSDLRRQFDLADKDGNGHLDAREACEFFARSCSPDATPEEVRRTAEALRSQVDTDRSGTVSFDEYCFRFGRRYQMERNRRRRQGLGQAAKAPEAAEVAEVAEAAEAADAEATEEVSDSGGSPAAASKDEAGSVEELRRALEAERKALEQERKALQAERERSAARHQQQGGSQTAGPTAGSAGTAAGTAGRQNESPAPPARFSAGTRVRLRGLQAAPQLNGRAASVLRFEEATGRYVVEVDAGLGQKSLRPENIEAEGHQGGWVQGILSQGMQHMQCAVAKVQLWMAGYEWWQLLLGAVVVVLIVLAWLQASSRYKGGGSGSTHRRSNPGSSGFDRPTATVEDWDDPAIGRASFSDDSYDSGHGSSGGLLGFEWGPMQRYLIIGGLVVLCWKGIIPVHRMDWFQLYMLWNMLQPLLQGGRRVPYGGYGRRRRFF